MRTQIINASFEPLLRIGKPESQFVIVRVESKDKLSTVDATNAYRAELKLDKTIATLPLILVHCDPETGVVSADGRSSEELEIIASKTFLQRNWLAFVWPEYTLTTAG
jgi:hypothetical protein